MQKKLRNAKNLENPIENYNDDNFPIYFNFIKFNRLILDEGHEILK